MFKKVQAGTQIHVKTVKSINCMFIIFAS